jgi:hypothetical protein
MEDGIESMLSLFSEKLKHKDVKITPSVQSADSLYLYIPANDTKRENTIISNCILFDNIEKIMEHSKHNTGQIAIFTKDTTGAYKISNLQ